MKRIIRLKVYMNRVVWWISGSSKPQEAKIKDLIRGYMLFLETFPQVKDHLIELFSLPIVDPKMEMAD